MALPHLPLGDGTDVLERLDPTEIEILHLRGAFNLPPRSVQDELIELYFRWVAPILPIIHKSSFLERYRDPRSAPSILLLQAIFLSVSRFSDDIKTKDGQKLPETASKIFFQRAKALYDSGYEQDTVTLVQSLVLMSWYWHGPQDVTENGLFYWSRLAIAVAQDSDVHRSAEDLSLTQPDLRLWKRIWWTLFTRDRAIAAAYGRPVSISTEHSRIEMVTEDDFIEDDEPPDPLHVQFFIQYVKICQVLEMVACRPIGRRESALVVRGRCEFELNKWLLDCPQELRWQQSSHEFWPAVLHFHYNTTLCQLYGLQPGRLDPAVSQTVVSEAASMILSTVECLVSHGQIKFSPPSVLFSIFTVLVTVKDQLSSTLPSIVLQSQRKVNTCLQLLTLLSKSWPIARMIREISELVLSEKRFGDLHEAAMQALCGEMEPKNMPAERNYKRSLLNEKQARPEFMLPRSRMIVKMVLSNRPDYRVPANTDFFAEKVAALLQTEDPTPISDRTQMSTANSSPDESMPQASNDTSETIYEIPSRPATPPRDISNLEEYSISEPIMIPLFGKGSWRRDLDQPCTGVQTTFDGDSGMMGSSVDEELALPASLDVEEWSSFLGRTDIF